MKKSLLVLTAATLFITANAQSENRNTIPSRVLTAFAAKYPGITVKKWRLKDNDYLAQFADEKHKHTAYYDGSGNWVKTDTKYYLLHTLPDAVKKKLRSSFFATWYIEDINEIESPTEHDYVFTVDSIVPWDNENSGWQRQVKVTISPDGRITNMDETKSDKSGWQFTK
jgi:hypothetical protein